MEFLHQVTYLKESNIFPSEKSITLNPALQELIEKASYYKEDELHDIDIETLKRIYRFRDNDPNLYIVYLATKKCISEDEQMYYNSLIKKLIKEEKNKINDILELLQNTVLSNE